MAVISKSITIKAPIGTVFTVVTTPENWTRYVASLVEVKNLSSEAPARGSTFGWTYKMMGLKFSGKGTVTENIKDKKFGLSLRSRVQINEDYEFIKKDADTTELKCRIEYEMPGEILKLITDSKLVEKLNALEAKTVLDKIKTLCEH